MNRHVAAPPALCFLPRLASKRGEGRVVDESNNYQWVILVSTSLMAVVLRGVVDPAP